MVINQKNNKLYIKFNMTSKKSLQLSLILDKQIYLQSLLTHYLETFTTVKVDIYRYRNIYKKTGLILL